MEKKKGVFTWERSSSFPFGYTRFLEINWRGKRRKIHVDKAMLGGVMLDKSTAINLKTGTVQHYKKHRHKWNPSGFGKGILKCSCGAYRI